MISVFGRSCDFSHLRKVWRVSRVCDVILILPDGRWVLKGITRLERCDLDMELLREVGPLNIYSCAWLGPEYASMIVQNMVIPSEKSNHSLGRANQRSAPLAESPPNSRIVSLEVVCWSPSVVGLGLDVTRQKRAKEEQHEAGPARTLRLSVLR
jgi:hypothetical protein